MEKGIYYKFVKMDLSQFATFDEGIAINDGEEVGIGIKHQFAYKFSRGLVLCKTTVDYSLYQSNLLKAELDCIFQIDSESVERLEKDGGEITLPSGLLRQLASLAYGTLRGIIFAKTMNTQLNNIILPLADVREFVKDDVVFKKDEKICGF